MLPILPDLGDVCVVVVAPPVLPPDVPKVGVEQHPRDNDGGEDEGEAEVRARLELMVDHTHRLACLHDVHRVAHRDKHSQEGPDPEGNGLALLDGHPAVAVHNHGKGENYNR